ncbi:GatB/YqeY domain-containing protein [Sulfurivermis fontis]|uniref:GatB/YqeY domain-containing protein n=1 Tax=Sulfurivermis fontis TaxID=1972068 RepID=UPI000FDC714B|nr:GatB/YqeY domain-containing protein [Sulfurivermis fontis]
MSQESLKQRIDADMKEAMRAKDKERLGTIRLILAAIKQREVDERITLDDTQVLTVLEKMVKQRRDSISQFEAAGRTDLAGKEKAELDLIQTYMPAQLSEAEIDAIIEQTIAATGATSAKDMGKVMGPLKAQLQGRADMGAVSARLKVRLSA